MSQDPQWQVELPGCTEKQHKEGASALVGNQFQVVVGHAPIEMIRPWYFYILSLLWCAQVANCILVFPVNYTLARLFSHHGSVVWLVVMYNPLFRACMTTGTFSKQKIQPTGLTTRG